MGEAIPPHIMKERYNIMVGLIHGTYWDTLWDNMHYWERCGDPEETALAKAFYWDYLEVWDFDHSWDDEKKIWVRFFILMFPNCKKPED